MMAELKKKSMLFGGMGQLEESERVEAGLVPTPPPTAKQGGRYDGHVEITPPVKPTGPTESSGLETFFGQLKKKLQGRK